MQESTARDATFPPEEAPTRRLPHALRQIGRPAAPRSFIRIRKVGNEEKDDAPTPSPSPSSPPSTRSMPTLPAPETDAVPVVVPVPVYVPRPTPIIIMPEDLREP